MKIKVVVISYFMEITVERNAILDTNTGKVSDISGIVKVEILDEEFKDYTLERIENELEFFTWDKDEVYTLDYSKHCILNIENSTIDIDFFYLFL